MLHHSTCHDLSLLHLLHDQVFDETLLLPSLDSCACNDIQLIWLQWSLQSSCIPISGPAIHYAIRNFKTPAAHCRLKRALLLQLLEVVMSCFCETRFAHASKFGHLSHLFVHAGNLCSSSRQQLASSNADAFSRGSTDEFALRLRHMGQLQELHIWHNGTGLATAWHLSLIIVADETNGERYCA